MDLVVDDLHPGTDESCWLGSAPLVGLRPLRIRPPRRLVVVAPHPDDEVLGAGGLMQCMHQVGAEVAVVAVTDGEASHPGARARGIDLASTRAVEAREALDRLACGPAPVARLGLPDGAVAEEIPGLTAALTARMEPGDLWLTPWRHDGHPDHDATGTATAAAARLTGIPVLEYLVWAWHWGTPEDPMLPWGDGRRLDLGRRRTARKRFATYAFTSQIRPWDSGSRRGPVLADSVLRRFWRPFEVFIEGEA